VADLTSGEMTCQVHLAATVKGLMTNGGALIAIRQIQNNTNPVVHFCTCRLAAEFHLVNVGRSDVDDPFPLFQQIREEGTR
jgi:hypothetical protein